MTVKEVSTSFLPFLRSQVLNGTLITIEIGQDTAVWNIPVKGKRNSIFIDQIHKDENTNDLTDQEVDNKNKLST